MTRLLFVISLYLLVQLCIAQGLSDEERLYFYEKAIEDHYAHHTYDSLEHEHLILNDSLPIDLKLEYHTFSLKLVTEEAALDIIEERKGKTGILDKIKVKEIDQDTIDLNIMSWNVSVEQTLKIRKGRLVTRNINFVSSCAGTTGYIPTARLIFNRELGKWEYYSYAMLLQKQRFH